MEWLMQRSSLDIEQGYFECHPVKKQLYGYFRRHIVELHTAKRENLKRERKSLVIATENNVIRSKLRQRFCLFFVGDP